MEELLKAMASEKKAHLGLKEVRKNLKGLKLVIYSKDLTESEKNELKSGEATALEFNGSPYALGRAIGRNHPVKAIGVKSLSERAELELKKVIQGA